MCRVVSRDGKPAFLADLWGIEACDEVKPPLFLLEIELGRAGRAGDLDKRAVACFWPEPGRGSNANTERRPLPGSGRQGKVLERTNSAEHGKMSTKGRPDSTGYWAFVLLGYCTGRLLDQQHLIVGSFCFENLR